MRSRTNRAVMIRGQNVGGKGVSGRVRVVLACVRTVRSGRTNSTALIRGRPACNVASTESMNTVPVCVVCVREGGRMCVSVSESVSE